MKTRRKARLADISRYYLMWRGWFLFGFGCLAESKSNWIDEGQIEFEEQ